MLHHADRIPLLNTTAFLRWNMQPVKFLTTAKTTNRKEAFQMAQRFRLHSMPSAQCYVTIQHDSVPNRTIVELTSYDTLVCSAILDSENGLRLLCSGTYSRTTARHINRFTTEFFGENLYHECKRAVSNSHCFTEERIAFATMHEVFRVPPYTKPSPRVSAFKHCIDCYKNDSFGYGSVKQYRGHY